MKADNAKPSRGHGVQDVRRKIDNTKTTATKVELMFERYMETLPAPRPNGEKIDQMHRKVRPFVPEQFHDDPLYAAPTPAEAAQRARLKRRADMAAEAKHIQEERVDAPSFVDQLQKLWKPLKKRGAQRLNEKKPCF
ncbi:hypothetical protein L915_14150 [Phytophthora nicotianae]|uniref:Uncharacterized protein n=1 Tax=Phytophthora nicotianae TaxID=4792 RepID=W2GAP3_PHYNI|nr:hypothetical protein L915_14150 [Phytophthora nicotianae]